MKEEGKTAAIVAHLFLIGSLIAITMNMEPKNSFARFHIRQAFGIHLLYHGLAIVFSYVQIIQTSFWLFIGYCILLIVSIIRAYNLKQETLPGIGPYFQKWFTFIQ